MPTVKVKCFCVHEQQDRMHGRGVRVANINAKNEGKCTVCSHKHTLPAAAIGKKKAGGGGRGGCKSFVAIPPQEGWLGGFPEKNGYRKI